MEPIYVIGVGIISAIGHDKESNLRQLREGKSGLGKAQFLDSRFAESHPFGEVAKSNEELLDDLKLTEKRCRTDLLAHQAFEESIESADLSKEEISSSRTAFISATTVGGMCLTQNVWEDANYKVEKSDTTKLYQGHVHLMHLVERFKMRGYTDCFNTACSSSANAIMLGARLIRSGRSDRAIVGGVDSLCRFTANGFNALNILSDQYCKPFDEGRAGLNLGEGAAYLVLEKESNLGSRKPIAEIKGWGNATDAHHPSALSEEGCGPRASIQAAIAESGISASELDCVNAHGTATENNDRTELLAMQKTVSHLPLFTSTKCYTGHTLAAAGAVEAVYSVMSLQHNEIYSTLGIEHPMAGSESSLVRSHLSDHEVRNVLSNSFGFAGNCSSLIFSRS